MPFDCDALIEAANTNIRLIVSVVRLIFRFSKWIRYLFHIHAEGGGSKLINIELLKAVEWS